MTLSKIQKVALIGLASAPRGEASAYELKHFTGHRISTATMWALSSRGLAGMISAPGNMAFPANAVWRITEAGRRAAES